MASSTVEKPKSDAVNSAADGSGLDADGGSSRSHRLRAILPIASVVVFLAAGRSSADGSTRSSRHSDRSRQGVLGPAEDRAARAGVRLGDGRPRHWLHPRSGGRHRRRCGHGAEPYGRAGA